MRIITCGLVVLCASSAFAAQTVFIGGSRAGGTTPYTVNTSTGAATLWGNPVGLIEGMSLDTTRNRIVATLRNDTSIKTIDPNTGVVGSLTFSVPASIEGLAYDSNRDLFWGTDQSGGGLYQINPLTGQTTLVAPLISGGLARPGGLGYDPATDRLYGLDDNRLYSINPTTFVATAIGPAGFGVGFTDVDAAEFDTQTGLIYIVNDLGGGPSNMLQRFASLDPATGLATVIGPTGLLEQFGQGMAIIAPEPSSLGLIASSFALLRRRR